MLEPVSSERNTTRVYAALAGLVALLLPSFMYGDRFVMMFKWSAEAALGLIQRERITRMSGVPTMTLELLASPALAAHDTSSLMVLSQVRIRVGCVCVGCLWFGFPRFVACRFGRGWVVVEVWGILAPGAPGATASLTQWVVCGVRVAPQPRRTRSRRSMYVRSQESLWRDRNVLDWDQP